MFQYVNYNQTDKIDISEDSGSKKAILLQKKHELWYRFFEYKIHRYE